MDNPRPGEMSYRNSKVLDLDHLAHYTAGDTSLQSELLGLFAEQMKVQIRLLEAGAEGQGWMIATHTLKGAARAVGAWSVAEAAEVLETLDPAKDVAECTKQLGLLRTLAAECETAIGVVCEAA